MAMLDHVRQQQTITKTLMGALACGLAVFSLLLIAVALRLADGSGTQAGQIGPLHLFNVSKLPLKTGGYQGSFSLMAKGFAMYMVGIIGLGLLMGLYRVRRSAKV